MDERAYAEEEIDRDLIEGLLGLPPAQVKGIFVFGSHAFGTATPLSGRQERTTISLTSIQKKTEKNKLEKERTLGKIKFSDT